MGERPPLDAVLLDAGGTLVRLDFESMAASLEAFGARVDAAALAHAEVAGRRRYDATRGWPAGVTAEHAPHGIAGDIHAYFDGMLEAAGVPSSHRPAALQSWLQRQLWTGLWVRPMEGAREAVRGLTGLGLRCAVVSNSDGRAEQHLRDCDLLGGIEFVVDSHRVGVEKPDREIFRHALDGLGVRPERALFVGDIRSVDEAGARAAGLHFVLLDPFGDYAPPGTAAIRGMQELAGWVAARFTPPGAGNDSSADRGARRGAGDPS